MPTILTGGGLLLTHPDVTYNMYMYMYVPVDARARPTDRLSVTAGRPPVRRCSSSVVTVTI